MKVSLNGNPVYTVSPHTSCGTEICELDSYIQHAAGTNDITDVVYRYVGNMAEDVGEPAWQISQYVAKALWNDGSALLSHISKIFDF